VGICVYFILFSLIFKDIIMATDNQPHTVVDGVEEHDAGMSKKKIWTVFYYLLALTCIEFIIALGFVHSGILERGLLVNIIYIVLTLIKAYYIIAYFMHLKFERLGLVLILGLSLILIVYFIILLFIEGSYLGLHIY